MSSRDLWTSRLGFILASAGAAVGLGAIWKFPYMAGTNGGSAFIIPYILFCFTLGMFLLLAEMVVGRAGRAASINSMIRVGKSKFWGIFGTVGIATGFLILTFYSTIGGWCVAYAVDAAMGNGIITDLSQLGTHFNNFASDPVLGIFYQIVFMIMTAGVVIFGVQAGIERLAKYLMPTLFILMIVLIIRGLTLPGAWQGVEFMFSFNWDEFNAAFRRFFVQIPGGEENAGKTEAFCLFDPILQPGNGTAFARKTQFAQRDQIIRHRAVCQ